MQVIFSDPLIVPIEGTEPGEWQTDKQGKRYRKSPTGGIEYEMDVNGVPQSVFLESNRRDRERREEQIKEERRKMAEQAAQRRNCPFKDGLNTDCSREACALFVDNGCSLTRLTSRQPAKDTAGLICPLDRYRSKCRTDCALYKMCALHGCVFTAIITESEEQ